MDPLLRYSSSGRRARRSIWSLAAAALLASLAPASAGADTLTFGSKLPKPTIGTYDYCANPCTLAQLGTPGTQLVSPVSGTITAFRLRTAAGSVPQTIRFRVLRSADGSRFTGAGTSAPVQLSTTAGITEYPVSMPVEAGDVVGIDQQGGNIKANIVAYNPGAFQGGWFPALGDGVTPKASDNLQGSAPTRYEMLLQAKVRYDRKGQTGCTDPKTLEALCADPNGPPAICGPFTAYPQCNVPVSLPSVCSGTGTPFPTCNLPGNHIVACGGFGLNLPVCDLPPLEVPDVCGPTTVGLKPCGPANVQVLACGPTDLGFPPCAFDTLIKAPKPIGLDDGHLDHETRHGLAIETTLGCPGEDPGRAGRRGDGEQCVATVDLIALAEAKIGALSLQARALSRLFEQDRPAGSLNAAAFRDRTDREVDIYIVRPLDGSERFRPMSSRDRAETIRRLSRKDGRPAYAGPAEIYDNYLTRGAISGWTDSLGAAVAELAKVQKQAKKGGRSGSALVEGSLLRRATAAAKPGKPLLEKRITLSREEPTEVRLRLKKAALKKLLGKKPKKARALPVRFVVSYDTEPRPIARYVDFALKVKRK